MQFVPRPPSLKGPTEWFTGDVYIDLLARGEDPSRIQVAAVRFTPARARPGTPTGSGRPSS